MCVCVCVCVFLSVCVYVIVCTLSDVVFVQTSSLANNLLLVCRYLWTNLLA